MSDETQNDIGLYIVMTERINDGPKVKTIEYRVLARSVIEAAEIVMKSSYGVEDEIVRESRYASHITGLPMNKFKIVPIESENNEN